MREYLERITFKGMWKNNELHGSEFSNLLGKCQIKEKNGKFFFEGEFVDGKKEG